MVGVYIYVWKRYTSVCIYTYTHYIYEYVYIYTCYVYVYTCVHVWAKGFSSLHPEVSSSSFYIVFRTLATFDGRRRDSTHSAGHVVVERAPTFGGKTARKLKHTYSHRVYQPNAPSLQG